MTNRLPLIPAVLAAAVAVAPPAAAQVPPPTLQWDRECYTERQPMAFSGAGYTPGGTVDLLFSRIGFVLGAFETTADGAGAVSGTVSAEVDQLLADDESRATRFVSANDRTRIEQGAEPQARFAAATFTFTRWMGFSPGRLVPGRRSWAEAYGWAFADGRPVYYLVRKGRRTVASVKLGTLAGPCGDVRKRFTVPRTLRPGRYTAYLSAEPRSPGERWTWRPITVARKASAAAASRSAATRMRRTG